MEFPEETPAAPRPITVKQLVYRLRDTVSIAVGTQWVVGELSNVKHHTSGHVYFTLKEQGAEIFCAFFKAAASKCWAAPPCTRTGASFNWSSGR